ncbi:MAG: hypothetical protein WA063_04630 [Minisyncoccia bacterium]
MQETEIDITSGDEIGFMEKIKNWSYENWQTILVVLIVLIVGMSAYNYNQNGTGSDTKNNSVALSEEDNANNENANGTEENNANEDINASSEAAVESTDQKIAANEDIKTEPDVLSNENTNKNNEEGTVLSSTDDNGKKYSVIAIRGEGITHLARHALEKFIQETNQGSDLTIEHKIYIEDYMQNRTGNEKINVGHEESFSEALITDAISSAKTLSSKSLENLAKYSIK